MVRLFAAVVALCASLALAADAEEAAPAAAAPLKLTLMPFAALSSDVPQRAGVKASGMLMQEFKNGEGLQLIDTRKKDAPDANADALAQARKDVEAAKDLRARRKFRLADEALAKALAGMRASAASLTDLSEVIDAYALAAAVQFNTGRDEEGAKSLATALALAPERPLPLASTSALFSKVVDDARKALKDGPKGTLQVETSPAGAALLIDGVALGGSPLLVKDVPPGLHFWRATLPNGEVVGGTVEVAAGKQAKASGTSSSKDPESRLLAQLAQNKLDPELMAAAKEHAAATQADLVVFGALSKDGKGLALDSFLYAAAGGELRRLPRSKFDTELLSAGMEFFNLAGALAKQGAKVGEAVKVPASVLTDRPMGQAKLGEAKYGVQPGKELNLDGVADGVNTEPVKDDGPRKPLDGKRTPLKKR
jgi:hypothetical protein